MAGSMIGSIATGGALAASAMNPVTAGLALAQPLFQGILAGVQGINAKRIQRQNPRPVQGIPGSQQEALDNARNMAMGLAPGTALAQNQLDRTLGGSISAIRDSGGGQAERLAALTRLDATAGTQVQQMQAAQQQYQQQMDMNLQAQLDRQAQYEQNAWEYNQNQPYQAAQAKAAALHDAANESAFNAIGGIGGAVASGLKKSGGAGAGSRQQAATGLAGGALESALGGAMGKVADPSKIEPITPRTPSVMGEPSYRYAPDGSMAAFVGLKNRVKFNPDAGTDNYDFDAIQGEYDKRKALDTQLGMEKIKGRASTMNLTPVTRTAPSFMPQGNQMGKTGRVFGPMTQYLLPEIDNMGRIQRRK